MEIIQITKTIILARLLKKSLNIDGFPKGIPLLLQSLVQTA